ncbi:site-specific DNA-methyltransferase [Anaerofustis stercorihominis]|uniref:Methyltransferase n=1 Tax=Anaerofustis stercorihominis TaxID=214853 RepID=A0A3E3DXE2_9FIRM|nr:site-specific DNA-methyltransferase [Anaerofustis stercorihominis]
MKIELYNDHFQNFKRYNIPKAQLIIADIPYNLGKNAYASSTEWYNDGDNKNGESEKANTEFFDTDKDFRIAEYMHFCSKMLKKEPKGKVKRGEQKSPAMIVFCSFEQMQMVIDYGKKYGFNHNIPLVFIKNYSSQVLKSNMRIVGATEYALVLYRERLPKFNNNGRMIFNWMNWEKDNIPKVHPTQKPLPVLKKLISIFTDEYDTVIDPVAGSGTTLRACSEMNRNAYGFEIKKDFYRAAKEKILKNRQMSLIGLDNFKQEVIYE